MIGELETVLPAGAVVSDPDVAEAYRRDQTPMLAAGRPLAVCFPSSTAEVAAVLRVATQHRIPVVTRGAGSGLAGGANAVDGCIVLVTTRMDQILDVDADDQLAVVQPGVLNVDVKTAARTVGLLYPPDPASFEFSTIGGNIATNAGGLCCVRYGVTGDYVLALEVVLADGNVVRTGRRTLKGVAGYDLTRLFVGSEGTLGVVTEATLRLRPDVSPPSTIVATFDDLQAAGDAVVRIASKSMPLLLELMDATTVAAVNEWQRMDLDASTAAMLLAQVEESDAAGIVAICEEAGATYAVATADADEASMLLAARRFAHPALERLGTTLLDDVAVPRTRIPALLAGIAAIAVDFGVVIGTFGHAGDGNFHPTIVYEAGDPYAEAVAQAAFDAVVNLALDLGGTITGEHGVGLLKRPHLERELGMGALAVHRAVKAALDPLGILNPGKVL